MRSLVGLLLSLVFTTGVFAGVTYDFQTSVETARFQEKITGRVWSEGDNYRAEIVRADGKRQIVISRDRDVSAMVVDPQKQTWSNRVRVGNGVRSASLFLWPIGKPELRGKPEVTYQRGATEVIAGQNAVEHVIEAKFRVMSRSDDSPVHGWYQLRARIWTAEELPALPMNTALRTGYAKIDEELDRHSANVQGMVLRHELEVTRTLEGGPEVKEKTTTVVTSLSSSPIDEAQFTVPDEFTYVGPEALTRK
ncbi:MAG: hypothetical protein ACLGH0_12675 [Thermoanaerobaculia bacterium]